ncbi:hypothetical protein Taro_010281 [Colocasia esculenta]|uniref:Uncharacterized protein n=1 Tax=Colocasia esculenta TaxID=4460 RepID=A0A843U799_COLES|nr:hypothetical protein [Colocasia esculenta]
MKKLRGFRLSKRLVRVWRWVRRCRRLKLGAYVTLSHTATPSSSSRSPPFYSQHHRNKTATGTATAVTAKIADWGRSLTRRLAPSSAVCSRGGGRAGGEDDGHLLPCHHDKDKRGLHRRHRKQQQQGGEEEEDVDWWKPPPKGHLAVYVGARGVEPPRRVLVPVVYFNHPLFGELLREAEEEFGFHHPGGITIPCPVADFESVRRRVAAASTAGVCSRRGGKAAGQRC